MKKLSVLFISLVAFGAAVTSCSKNDDVVAGSKFQGNWAGTSTGNGSNGTWTGSIDTSGKITGNVTISSKVYELKGSVDSKGVLTASFKDSSVMGTFDGQLTAKDAAGTWTTLSYNGTWNGTKQ